jgi:thymidylate synthase (FAD)
LLRYLLRSKHSTPFEQVVLKFHLKLPIFVARQLVRHRTQSLNEYSMRYSLAPMQFYIPEFDNYQKQSKANRQGRTEQSDRAVYERISNAWRKMQEACSELYQDQILEDIARELARIHLPLSLYTEWYATMNLHNLMHLLGLRSDVHAQWECQKYSNLKAGIAKVVAPVAFEAWIDYRHCATSLSRMEWNVLRQIVGATTDRIGVRGDHCSFSAAGLGEQFGLDKREIGELLAKFSSIDDIPIPNYDLDLSQAKTPEHFHDLAKAAVPERIRDK